MTATPDYYEILGVTPTSEDVVIRGAYRGLMQKYHPDIAPSDSTEAAEKVREVNEAYNVLRDPEKRVAYDASRKTAAAEDTPMAATSPATPELAGVAAPSHVSTLTSASMAAASSNQARHVVVTAVYLAGVLIVLLLVRSFVTFGNSDPPYRPESTALSVASKPAQHVASAKPVGVSSPPKPAVSHKPVPVTHGVAVSAPPAIPAPPPTTPEAPASKSMTSEQTKAAAAFGEMTASKPARQARPIETAQMSESNSDDAPAYRHQPRRHRIYDYQAYDTHVEPGGSSDEAQTRWLNERSARTRPRWHLQRGNH